MPASDVAEWSDALEGACVEFASNHVIVSGNNHCSRLGRFDDRAVLDLFSQYGSILFRNFRVDYSEFSAMTKRFCSGFLAQEAGGRMTMATDKATQTVNQGNDAFPYHPELSQYPWQPDIAWFCCAETPKHKNEGTIICDGIELARILDPEDKELLATNKLVYSYKQSREIVRNALEINLPEDNEVQSCNDPRTYTYDIRDGELWASYTCDGLPTPLFSDAPAFNSFMLFARLHNYVNEFPVLGNGKQISDEFIQRVSNKADTIASQMDWQKGDLLMINNTRFMHARPAIIDPQKRMILTRFGYAKHHPERDELSQFCPWRREGVTFSQFAGVISTQ